jgi:hypothetical protein
MHLQYRLNCVEDKLIIERDYSVPCSSDNKVRVVEYAKKFGGIAFTRRNECDLVRNLCTIFNISTDAIKDEMPLFVTIEQLINGKDVSEEDLVRDSWELSACSTKRLSSRTELILKMYFVKFKEAIGLLFPKEFITTVRYPAVFSGDVST